MAKNVVRNAGSPQYATTKNVGSAKLSGALISFPLTAGFNVPVALLTRDAGTSEDGVSCILGGVVVRYAALSTDTADPGTILFFDIANNRLTTDSGTSTHNKAGRAAKSKINGDTTADLYLNMP
jgi:hypothetical protein